MPSHRHLACKLNYFQSIILLFAVVILIGAALLMLPISAQERMVTPFHEALFTATSAVCVTGLVVRPLFYTGALWHAREFGRAPVLFLPQGNYPLKNLHTVIRALPAVRQQFPGATLHIAGWPPLDKGPLLRPIIDRMFPYKLYCKRLAVQLGVADALHYTGPLDAAAMRQAYLEADVFLLPSSCENSPNSLGEAMLLGMPCVASNAGGIPDMLAAGREGLLYGESQDADALARCLLQVLTAPDGGTALGQAARARALHTHDAAANAAALVGIYETILKGDAQ